MKIIILLFDAVISFFFRRIHRVMETPVSPLHVTRRDIFHVAPSENGALCLDGGDRIFFQVIKEKKADNKC